MNIRQKERIFFFFTHALTILSLFTYSVCDEKVKMGQPTIVNSILKELKYTKRMRVMDSEKISRKVGRRAQIENNRLIGYFD